MDEWVVWFYVEPFTLHLKRDRGRHPFTRIALVLVPFLVSLPDTASVITPMGHWVQANKHAGDERCVLILKSKEYVNQNPKHEYQWPRISNILKKKFHHDSLVSHKLPL